MFVINGPTYRVEKACREFVTLFLQGELCSFISYSRLTSPPVLDDGRLTDGQGRVVDFRNCVIVQTRHVDVTAPCDER